MKTLIRIVVILLAVLFLLSCQTESIEDELFEEYIYSIPEVTGDMWETASVTDVGINMVNITEMMNWMSRNRGHLIHSILIARNGKLVFEEYFPGRIHPTIGDYGVDYNRDTMHVLSSATKSYTSALLGIAIETGFIESVEQSVFDFFPELAHLKTGGKEVLNIRHMITMASGIQWDQTTYPILDHRNDIAKIQRAEDPWSWYLSRPLVVDPGTRFHYSEACLNMVGEIIKRASGIRLDHFAEQYLFTPLGINQHWWYLVWGHEDFIWASGDLRQRPRDMLKFGQLYLNEGKWKGTQIAPAEWVKESVTEVFSLDGMPRGHVGYAYAWWTKGEEYGPGAFAASGWGGQHIVVVPAHDLVVVFTGGSYYQTPPKSYDDIMTEYILPAM